MKCDTDICPSNIFNECRNPFYIQGNPTSTSHCHYFTYNLDLENEGRNQSNAIQNQIHDKNTEIRQLKTLLDKKETDKIDLLNKHAIELNTIQQTHTSELNTLTAIIQDQDELIKRLRIQIAELQHKPTNSIEGLDV